MPAACSAVINGSARYLRIISVLAESKINRIPVFQAKLSAQAGNSMF